MAPTKPAPTKLVLTLERFQPAESPQGSSDQSFGFVFAAAFALIALSPLRHHHGIRWWAAGVSATLAAVALSRPALLHPANVWWTKLSFLLHKVMSPVAMGMIFFAVATPIGLLMRRFGKDPLRLRFDPNATTYWQERSPPGPNPNNMGKQF